MTEQEFFNNEVKKLIEFCKKENRLPSRLVKNERRLREFLNYNRHHPVVSNIIEKYKKYFPTFEEKIKLIKKFCEENKRLPNRSEKEYYRYTFEVAHEAEVSKIIEKYREKEKTSKKLSTYRKKLENFLFFCKENNRLPKSCNRNEASLYQFMRENKYDKKVYKIILKYPKKRSKKFNKELEDLKLFCTENRRLPEESKTSPYITYRENKLNIFMNDNKDDISVKNLISKYKKK